MNHTEAVILCRIVKSYCPQQHFDDYSPDAWYDLLGDLRFVDAKEAAAAIARQQPFVAPAEIRAAVRVIRNARIAQAPPSTPPEWIGDDEVAYRRWLAGERRRIADGDPVPEDPRLPVRDMKIIESAFRAPS